MTTEADENYPRLDALEGRKGVTPIIEGHWKVNVHVNEGGDVMGFRRYHLHDNDKQWYCVKRNLTLHEYECGNCCESVPAEMEGYIKLARWAIDVEEVF